MVKFSIVWFFIQNQSEVPPSADTVHTDNDALLFPDSALSRQTGDLGEEWEEEADKLYEWTQDLAFEDLDTPQLPV